MPQTVTNCILYLIFLLLIKPGAISANSDSLHKALSLVKSDTAKLKIINELLALNLRRNKDSAEYYKNLSLGFAKTSGLENKNFKGNYYNAVLLEAQKNYKEAFTAVNQALKIAVEQKNKENEVRTEMLKAEIYNDVFQTNEAINHFMYAADLAKKLNNPQLRIDVQLNYGIFYKKLDKPADALEQLMIAYNLLKNTQDYKSMFPCCINLGTMYERIKDNEKALKFYREAAAINGKTHDENGKAICYFKIGKVHSAKNNLDSARFYFDKTMQIHLKNSDEVGLISDFSNLAYCYSIEKNFKAADQYWDKSIELALKHKDTVRLFLVISPKSRSYLERNENEKALKLLEFAATFFNANTSKSVKSEVYLKTSTVYAKKGDYTKAYQYHVQHKLWSDSSNSINDSKRITELKLNFDFKNAQEKQALEAREKELLNQAQREKDKHQRNYLIVGLIFISIFLVIAVRSYRLKNRANHLLFNQKQEIENQKKLVDHKNKEINDSIHYAKRIQYTLLANKSFMDENLSANFVYFKPKDIVSGDFYWATKQGDKFFLAVCDSTGHGVPGAFMSLLSIGFLSEAINEKGIEQPNKVFDYVRKRLIENISKDGQRDGFDGILICFDKNAKTISYAAANNRPILIRNTNFIELGADRMPVGLGVRQNEFTLHTIELKPNETLYLYTDGFADQFGGPRGKKFMYKQLNDLLVSLSSQPMEKQKEELASVFENWTGNLEQVDDVCVIGIRV